MELCFWGATETVTGSKYLLTLDNERILVDCGLFQGHKELRLRNWDKLPLSPYKIDTVLLTHAHIDHSGYVPLLVKNGFSHKIYSTPGTKDLCSILLPDSGYLQEEEARLANKWGSSKHKPALPLYTAEDAKKALKQFESLDFGMEHKLTQNSTFSFHRAGHILGASFVKISFGSETLLFSGDMGRLNDPIMFDPEIMNGADYLVLESTYGDRLHDKSDAQQQLSEIITKTVERGGSIIIPAFAVGRTQNMLYYIYHLKKENRIPNIPVFLDSPMAINATNLLLNYKKDHHLTMDECTDISKNVTYIKTAEESKSIDQYKKPIIIISASGMAEGGRILHHLKAYASDPRNTLLFTGYQADGTRGDRIVKGEKEVKIFGEMIPVRAKVEILHNASAHADYQQILDWLSHFKKTPKKVFLTHGELKSAESLKMKIEEQFGWKCIIPRYLQSEYLGKGEGV